MQKDHIGVYTWLVLRVNYEPCLLLSHLLAFLTLRVSHQPIGDQRVVYLYNARC